ncbi:MAG TPA: hypothetical protein VJG83_01365 [archaeon]|nr:hypothetical protein [archaeon]
MHGRIAQSGSSLSTGDLRVLIYDANVSGNLVYDSGSDFNNAINDGVVDVVLGSNTQLDLNYGGYYYIDLSINGTDLDFNGSERKQFESSHGVVKTGSILDATITNSDISSTASIDWTKISKTGADLNALKWGSDFNSQYARKTADDNVTGAWNFANTTTWNGGFGQGGITIQNGVLYTQSLVILNDLNAATVTAIDVNGNYTPFLDVTWSLGSSTNRWLGIFTRDLNATDINSTRASIGTLTLGTPLAKSQGGTGTTDFNSNGIVFYNGSALQNRSNFVVAADGNVGIGTTTPTKTLHVVGDANITGNTYLNGNVGIGTTEPSGKLDIKGASTGDIFQLVLSSARNIGGLNRNWLMSLDRGVEGNFEITPSTLLGGYTFNTPALAINTAGNVGIGETSPGSKLSVSGGGSFGASYDTTAAPTNGLIIEGNVGIGVSSPSNKLDVNGNTRITGDLNVTGTSYLGNIILNATDLNVTNINPRDQNIIIKNTSGGEIARIIGAGTTSGNVGIGTTTPGAKLEIAGGGISIASPQSPQNDNYLEFRSDYPGHTDWRLYHSPNTHTTLSIQADQASVIDITSTQINLLKNHEAFGSQRIFTNGATNPVLTLKGHINEQTATILSVLKGTNQAATVPTIYTDGYVGIVDPTPDAILDVNGINKDTNVLRVDSNTTASPVTGLIVDKNGNVGVGTSSPSSGRLVIDGGHLTFATDATYTIGAPGANRPIYGYFSSAVRADNFYTYHDCASGIGCSGTLHGLVTISGGTAMQAVSSDAQAGITTDSDNGFYVKFSGSNRLFVSQDGNVGIATSSPTARLQVFAGSGDTNILSVNRSTGAPGLVVISDGNVGIGTANPQAPLHVFTNVSGAKGLIVQRGVNNQLATLQEWQDHDATMLAKVISNLNFATFASLMALT